MSIRSTLDRLDDESGSLALALSKRNLERARGIPCGPEEANLLEDMFSAVRRTKLRPLKVGGVAAIISAALLLGGSAIATWAWDSNGWLTQAVRGLGALGIAAGCAAYLRHEDRRIRLEREFEAIRLDLANGISIFDTEEP